MERLTRFAVPIAGLTNGNHQFEYEIDDKFFESFENAVINHANVHVDLDFLKTETLLTLTFLMEGNLQLTCDRCLGDVILPVNKTEILLVRFGETAVSDTDDIIVMSHAEHHLNVAQHIYDYLSLMVPIRVVHPDDENGISTCDPDFLDKLDGEVNEKEADPRWEVLKNLRNRKN